MTHKYLGFDNKYGRPIPYVWFIILAVSSIPQLLMGSILDSIPCTESDILNGRTPEQYLKEKGFTISNAVIKCSELEAPMPWVARGFSVVISAIMFFTLKPWPLSSTK